MTPKQRLSVLRLFVFAATIVALAYLAGAAIRLSGHELVYNDSPSVPPGIYWIRLGAAPVRRGDYVIFAPTDGAASLIYGRGWLPEGMPLLKPVGGLAGDTYCWKDGHFIVNGVIAGPVFLLDSQGLPLPQGAGCRNVARGEFLPVSSYVDRSFDGRYMGVVALANVIGTGFPLLTF
jgi:conjugative transfer signal peptidase TraF